MHRFQPQLNQPPRLSPLAPPRAVGRASRSLSAASSAARAAARARAQRGSPSRGDYARARPPGPRLKTHSRRLPTRFNVSFCTCMYTMSENGLRENAHHRDYCCRRQNSPSPLPAESLLPSDGLRTLLRTNTTIAKTNRSLHYLCRYRNHTYFLSQTTLRL